MMKTILVTGGNRGIGLEICRQLDAMGHRVVMGSRDAEKGRLAATSLGANVIVKQLDVTDEESILQLYENLKIEIGNLDVLINNAGINESSFYKDPGLLLRAKTFLEKNIPGAGALSRTLLPALRDAGIISKRKSAADIPMDISRFIMETNFYGPWRMIQVFLPLLQKSPDGRIINVSSGMGEWNSLSGDYAAYRLSKTSLNALTVMFARELHGEGIRVNAMCPGWVRTDMGGANAPRTVEQGADTAVWLATENNIPTGKFFRDRKEIPW